MEPGIETTNEFSNGWYRRTIDRAASNLQHTVALAGLNLPVEEFITDDGEFVVHMDLPGLDPDDIEARVSKRELIIEARRRRNRDVLRENLVRSEIAYGTIRRSLPLPSWVRNGSADVRYENGVIEVRLKTDPATCPRASAFRPRKVSGKRRDAEPGQVSSGKSSRAPSSA